MRFKLTLLLLVAIFTSHSVFCEEAKNDQKTVSFTQIPLPTLAAGEHPDKLLNDEKGAVYLVTGHYNKDKASQPHREKISIYEFVNKTFKRITEYSYKAPFDYDIKIGGGRIYLVIFEEFCGCVGSINLLDVMLFRNKKWESITKGCLKNEKEIDYFVNPITFLDRTYALNIENRPANRGFCKYDEKWKSGIATTPCSMATYSEYLLNNDNGLVIVCNPLEYIKNKYGEDALVEKTGLKIYWMYKENKGNWEMVGELPSFEMLPFLSALLYSNGSYLLSYLQGTQTCAPEMPCDLEILKKAKKAWEKVTIPQELKEPLYKTGMLHYEKGKTVLLYAIKNAPNDDNLYLYSYDGNTWSKKASIPNVSREDKVELINTNSSEILVVFMDRIKKQSQAYLLQ